MFDLTPFIPLSLKGEGEGEILKGLSPFKLRLINGFGGGKHGERNLRKPRN